MKVGTRVRIKREKVVRHFAIAGMPITGTVLSYDSNHYEGKHKREYEIKFDDGRVSWYGGWEIAKG